MAVTVRIPTPLRKFTEGQDKVEVQGATIAQVLSALSAAHPGLEARICDESGAPKRFVNIYYKDEDIRFLDSVQTKVEDGTEVSIVPAIAGGR